jgi:hypothetical protein
MLYPSVSFMKERLLIPKVTYFLEACIKPSRRLKQVQKPIRLEKTSSENDDVDCIKILTE